MNRNLAQTKPHNLSAAFSTYVRDGLASLAKHSLGCLSLSRKELLGLQPWHILESASHGDLLVIENSESPQGARVLTDEQSRLTPTDANG